MKERFQFALVAVAFVVASSCWWLWPRSAAPEKPHQTLASPPPAAPLAAAPLIAALPAQTAAPLLTATPDLRNKAEQASAILLATSRSPIAFYGKVVDQHGAPVAGVKVSAGVRAVTQFMEDQREEFLTSTKSDGSFQFTGLHGQELAIYLTKDGYEFKSTLKRYEYSDHTPEAQRHQLGPATPEVFTMWKQQGAEPMVHVEIERTGIPVDGTPRSFDLLTGKKLLSSSGGDMVLTLVRQPEHIQRGQHFDWRATIEVPGGGLVAMNDAYPNEAPAGAYSTQLAIEMPASAKDWQSWAKRSYYVKFRGGKCYARMTLEFTADYEPPPTGVTLEAWINSAGSRNLEFDPEIELIQ